MAEPRLAKYVLAGAHAFCITCNENLTISEIDMTIRHRGAALATTVLFAACVQGNVVQESPGALEAAPTWATAAAPETGTRVTASLAPDGPAQTIAMLRLTGAPTGATYSWQIHYGNCQSDLGVIGESRAYPNVTVDSAGTATSRATLPFTTPSRRSGSFFVKVHEAGDMSKVVACSDLIPKGVRAASY